MHFWMLFRKEVEQNYQWVLGAAAVILLLSLVIQFQVKDSEVRLALSSALLMLPFLDALVKGFYQIRNEYARNTHYFLRSLPTSGLHILASKYLWIAVEVLLLTVFVLLPIFYFILTSQPGAFQQFLDGLREVLARNQLNEFLKAVFGLVLGVLPLPVMAYVAQLVGQRIGRAEWLVSGITYLTMWWLGFTLYDQLNVLRDGSPISMVNGNIELTLPYVIFQLTVSALLLLLSGWLFDQQDL